MSAALAAHPADNSNFSLPEFSLGSLSTGLPGLATPSHSRNALRIPSASSAPSSALVQTPPPPFSHRKGQDSLSRRQNLHDELDDADANFMDTPGEKKKWDAPDTPLATRPKRTRASVGGTKGVTLTLRDQEKHIDNLKKENFSIKLRVHFLEERLAELAPDQTDAALKQNINLKIEVQQRGMEMKKLKKLVLELERELERLQRGSGGARGNRERELEEKLEERDREVERLREMLRRKRGDNEESRRNVELEEELEGTRVLLEENVEEMERLREMVEHNKMNGSMMSEGGNAQTRRLERRVEELEGENEELRSKLDEHGELLTQREDEKEDLADQIEALHLQLEDLQRRREAESHERSQSRAQILEEREEREMVEDDLNALRDKLAAVMIELQQREEEVEEKNREINEIISEHRKIVDVVEDEWRGEVEEARGQVEELRDVLAERESESKDLRLNISELESNTNDLHAKFEAALAHLEEETEAKDAELEAKEAELEEKELEIEGLNEAMEKLGDQIYVLEDENDRMREEADRMKENREDDDVERERLGAMVDALKEKINTLKAQLQETTELYEACSEDIHSHRSRQEELARHVEDLVADLQRECALRERVVSELEAAQKQHDTALRHERRELEAKDSALQSALQDLSSTQSLLSQRDSDLQAVQNALETLEKESKKLGETHTTARFSLQLEVDRLKRDLERVEDELARARRDLGEREEKGRDRDGSLDKLYADNRDLASQLATQTQARLNISEKLDAVQASLRTAEGELVVFKGRVGELESRLSKDQRVLLAAEGQYRDQLTERNTLLLTIYQYMDKILGVDKTPKKSGQAETKPFTNFGVFHDNLITRLKALSQIQLDFDKRCRDVEGRYTEKMNDMRKQLDARWKQIDKFEASVKTYAETKAGWRRKFSSKEGELDAIKATNAEMAAQLAGMKRPGQTDAMELRSLTTRAANAERRLNNAQNQLLATEEKVAAMNQKNAAADGKWEARVREYESRLKAAEERVKRERQGSKERVGELEASLKSLQRQFELAQKRNQQLTDVIDVNKIPSSGSGSPSR